MTVSFIIPQINLNYVSPTVNVVESAFTFPLNKILTFEKEEKL